MLSARHDIADASPAGFCAGRLPEWFDVVKHFAFLADRPSQLGESFD